MKIRTIAFAIAASAAALATPSVTPPARAAQGTYDIPVIDDLTGAAAFLGKEEQQALELFEKLVNKQGGVDGKQLHFVFHDDESNPQVAVQLLDDVLAQHPPLVLGSGFVSTCNAMAPLVKNGPVMYCFSPGIHPPAGSYVFTAGTSTYDQAGALVSYFRLRDWNRIAIMTSTDATGQDADEGFQKLLSEPQNRDIKIVAHEHFNTQDVSVAAQIARIKATNAQVFYGWATGTPSATIFRGAVQGGLTLPMGTTGGNMTYAQMKRFAAFLPRELYMPSPLWVVGSAPKPVVALPAAVVAKQKDFYEAFAAAGEKPDEPSTLAWEPANLLVDAIRKLGTNVTAAQLRNYLVHLKGAAGIDGIYNFEKYPQRGLSIDNVVVTLWNPKDQRWDVVSKPTGVPLGK